MKHGNRLHRPLGLASTLVLAASGTLAQQADDYAPLALANRPLQTGLAPDYSGQAQLGLGYTSKDNYTFGQYNGLYRKEATLIGNLQWQDYRSPDSFWQVSGYDLGLDTREGELVWGRPGQVRLTLGFDSQIQVGNDSGRTPFRGSSNQQLPGDWVSGLQTANWTALDASLKRFDQELKRDKLYLEADTQLDSNWRLHTGFSYEDKHGNADVGGAIYVDASSGDAVLLKQPVDYRTTEIDIGLTYSEGGLHLDGQLHYSDFDNKDNVLTWQNPYSSFGPNVRYPAGEGGLGLAPDNDLLSGRLTGQYLFADGMRLQFDGSYARASQDQDFLDYSVNPALVVTNPVPRSNYGGEVDTSTFNTRLFLRPLYKVNTQLYYKYRNRDYSADRDGYQYIRGDGSSQPGTAATVYNTNHDFRSQVAGVQASYRLPLRSKLTFTYEFEQVERENAAVEKTRQDSYSLAYRIQPWSNFTARLELGYADRRANTYQWAQSYYALLDVELINATPDSQRYITHPGLSVYYLSNREQYTSKANFTWLPSDRWNLNLDLQWRDDDYDKSQLGLTRAQWYRAYVSASLVASPTLSTSLYSGYDYYDTDQGSRAFSGGPEKNAFAVYPPLPQASDPLQDWDIQSEDTSITLGASVQWQPAADFELAVDYSFVHTTAQQDLGTRQNSPLEVSDLPDVKTRLHHLEVSGTWQMQDNLSLRLDYQYYRYKDDDWAWEGVQVDTIPKVLSFGQSNPNDQINYVGASVIYRWQ